MPTTTQTPQQIVSDRKVAGMLDDLLEDCLDADKTAKKLSSGRVYRALDSGSRGRFDSEWDELLSAVDASEKERDLCLKGKAKDTRKLKTCIQDQLDALSVLEEGIGRVEVLEDTALETATTTALASVTLILGIWPKVALVQRDLDYVAKQLEKATAAARDAKVKATVAAALGAVGICLASFGTAAAVAGGVTVFSVNLALGAALDGNEESAVKKTWKVAAGGGARRLRRSSACPTPWVRRCCWSGGASTSVSASRTNVTRLTWKRGSKP